MSNVLTNLYQTKVQPQLYKQLRWGVTSSWMENNARGIQYNGGKYVLMHEMSVDGLGDYDRNLGYPRGSINGSLKQYELTKDRGREFLIDAADNDETGFLVNGASVMAEFQAAHVIPEVDSYRYSKLFADVQTGAPDNIDDTAMETTELVDLLVGDCAAIRDRVGDIPLVITMSGLVQQHLGRQFTQSLDVVNFNRGGIFTKVKALDGDPIMIVPSARLKTAYTYRDGVSAGQEAGGFVAADGAKDIKWIIMPITAPIAVGKIDKMRAFSPDEYQDAHAWKVDYRLFHDLWIMPNGYNNSFIRTGTISEPAE